MLETLYLAEDVYSDAEIVEAVATVEVKEPELALAHQIIDGLGGSFEPAALTSAYRGQLRALLEAKLEGAELPPPSEPEAEKAPAVDLLEALKASVEAAKGGTAPGSKSAAPKAKKSSAKSRRQVAGLVTSSKHWTRVSPAETGGDTPCRKALGVLCDGRVAGFELRLEKMLVDLAVVNRDALLDAELDDRVAVDAELL